MVDVGRGVTGFAAGDRVVGEVAIGCGVCVRCRGGAPPPVRAPDGDRHRAHGRRDGDADGLPGGVRAPGRRSSRARARWSSRPRWRCTRCAAGRVAGQRVLVVGAGPIGLLAAQCARAEGAAEVVVSDTREDRLTLAAALGFPRVAASPAGDAGCDEPGPRRPRRTPAGATPRRSQRSSPRRASAT